MTQTETTGLQFLRQTDSRGTMTTERHRHSVTQTQIDTDSHRQMDFRQNRLLV